jgi:glucose-1-phosphatase
MSAMSSVEVLLFDLGGVLLEYTGVRDLAPLLPEPMSVDEILARWSRCQPTAAFGVGRISTDEFVERFVRDWGIALEPARFAEEFRSWSRDFYPGARELVAGLRQRYRVAALSNSNALHWDRNVKDLGINDVFDLALSSHQIGHVKPDHEAFRAALDRLGVQASAVLFFDDSRTNVESARVLGMQAVQVDGVAAIREFLGLP